MLFRKIAAPAISVVDAPEMIFPTTGKTLLIAVFVMRIANISLAPEINPAMFKYVVKAMVDIVNIDLQPQCINSAKEDNNF